MPLKRGRRWRAREVYHFCVVVFEARFGKAFTEIFEYAGAYVAGGELDRGLNVVQENGLAAAGRAAVPPALTGFGLEAQARFLRRQVLHFVNTFVRKHLFRFSAVRQCNGMLPDRFKLNTGSFQQTQDKQPLYRGGRGCIALVAEDKTV